eukprot:2480782-Pyramimonas_sp.AAC.2
MSAASSAPFAPLAIWAKSGGFKRYLLRGCIFSLCVGKAQLCALRGWGPVCLGSGDAPPAVSMGCSPSSLNSLCLFLPPSLGDVASPRFMLLSLCKLP